MIDILNSFLSEYDLTSDQIIKISSKIESLEIKKDDFFIKKGEISNKIGILIEGLLYAFYETHKLDDTVSRFFYIPDNIIVSSFESFSKNTPSNESIKAIEDTKLFVISKSNLEGLYHEIPAMAQIGKKFAEESYISALNRIHELQTLSNTQKIEKFIKEKGELSNRLQVGLKASYLGINRNEFSNYFKKKPKL